MEVSRRTGTVTFVADRPEAWTPEILEELFRDQPYRFSQEPERGQPCWWGPFLGVLAVLGIFVLLVRWDLGSLIDLDQTSSLGWVVLFGVAAGCSSCAPLVGGLVFALAPRWRGWKPHGAFAGGRLGAFLGLGALLGALGAGVRPSPVFSSVLVFGVALFMVGIGLSMLGVPWASRLGMPGMGALGRFIGNRALAGKGPWLAGALSVFLPCGFSLTVQGLALASGSPWRGVALMGAFALGTLPSLAIMGLSGASWGGLRGVWPQRMAGFFVLAAAIWSANTQLNILGIPRLAALGSPPAATQKTAEAPPLPGPQELTMKAGSRSYAPNSFSVKAGLPVRWHIEDAGFSGCTNAIQAPGLFEGTRPLVRGGTATVEFIPEKPGTYAFTCWMGMITGEIRVE